MGITADSGGVRSVERALAIVDLLGEHQALGLEELHYLTGLPKATAAPLLLDLSERTGLVVDLSCFDGERLEVMESAIPQVLRKRYPHTCQIVGHHASLFHSAMGRACLGELAVDEVQRLAAHERLRDDTVLRNIEEDAHKGFGQRTEGYWEYPVRLPFLIRAIALPVHAEGRLAGSIALHWPLDQAPVERVMNLHLSSLATTVDDVQRALAG